MMSVQQQRDETVRKLDRELTEWRFTFGWSVKHTDFYDYKEDGQFSGVVGNYSLFFSRFSSSSIFVRIHSTW